MGGIRTSNNRQLAVVLAAILLVAAIPFAYPLSAGPAKLLVHGGYMEPLTYFSVYRPLAAYSYDHPSSPVVSAWEWYLSWWGGPIDLMQ
jgi:hypothetical protein